MTLPRYSIPAPAEELPEYERNRLPGGDKGPGALEIKEQKNLKCTHFQRPSSELDLDWQYVAIRVTQDAVTSAIIADENMEAVKWEDGAKALPVSGPKDLLTHFYYRPDKNIIKRTAATRWAGFTPDSEYRKMNTWLGFEEDIEVSTSQSSQDLPVCQEPPCSTRSVFDCMEAICLSRKSELDRNEAYKKIIEKEMIGLGSTKERPDSVYIQEEKAATYEF